MPQTKKSWSFRRWRRRWNERFARGALRWRIWFDKHILSYETRRNWKRRWTRRSKKLGSAVEGVGFKILPHQPDAAPDTRWTILGKKLDAFMDARYPPAARLRHARAFREVWQEFTAPFRHANMAVRRWLGNFLMPALTPAGFKKQFVNWKGAVGSAAVLGLLAWIAFWAVPHWRLHTEHKWSAQARLLLNRGYQSRAAATALQVLQKNERNEAACRVFADLNERQGLSDAVQWRRKVVDSAPTISNRLDLAAAAVKFEPPPSPTARRVLNELGATATNLAQYHVVAAQFEARNGNSSVAQAHYLAAAAQDADNGEVMLALAMLRLQMRSATNIEAAESALVALAEQPEMSVRALRPLVALTANRGNYDAALEYSERVLANEASTFEDRVVHVDVLLRRRDPRGPAALRTLQEQVSANPHYVNQLASWMTGNGRAREALAWMAQLPPAIRRSDAVLVACADAYVADVDWTGLEKFLQTERPNWGTIEYVRQAFLARAYRGQGDSRSFKENFGRAKELAAGMYLRLGQFTDMISRWGWNNEVEGLWWELFNGYPNEARAPALLLASYFERGDTDGLRRVYEQQFSRQTNDIPLMNNLAMVLLLRQHDLPRAHKLAEAAHKRMPESAANTSTYAYSLACQGRAAEGRKLLESLGPDTLKVPSIAAYYAIICEAAGDHQTARRQLDYARQASLLPEESELIRKVRDRP